MSARFALPITLDLAGRRAVVVGGGPLAAGKADALRAAGAEVVEVAAGGYRPDVLDGARVAVVTGEDDADVAAVFADAEARGVLVNTMDDVAHCHFAFPAIVRRGDVQVAVSTAGRAPALARRLRVALEDDLPNSLGDLVDAVAAAREATLPRRVPLAEWIASWRSGLADLDGLLALCSQGRADEARDRIIGAVAREAS